MTRPTLLSLLCAAHVGCGRPAAGPGEPVSATFGPDGGSLTVTDASGATLLLTLPEGAIDETVEVVVSPVAPAEGEVARFTLLPAGGIFARQGTASITADGVTTRTALMWVDGAVQSPLPTDVASRSASAPIETFGYPGVGTEGFARMIAAGDATTLAARDLPCDEALALEEAFHAAGRRAGDPAYVSQQWTTTRAAVKACEDGGTEAIAALEQRACARFDAAVIDARAVAAESYEGFQEITEPLIAAAGDLQLTGATCDASAYGAVLDEKMAQLLTFFDARLAPDQLSDDLDAETDLLQELYVYDQLCQLADLSVCAPLREVLYPAVADKIRAAAWLQCQTRGNPYTLGQMYAETLEVGRRIRARLAPRGRREPWLGYARFTYGDLEEDVAYCASSLELFVFDADQPPAEVLPRPAPLAGGPAPGTGENEADLRLVPGGSLTIGGAVRTLPCADGSTPDDLLVVRVGGVQVASAGGAGDVFTVATQPIVLSTDALVAAAGPDATAWDIDVFREGTGCMGYTPTFKLYSLHASIPEPVVEADPCQPAAGDAVVEPDRTAFSTLAEGIATQDGFRLDGDTDRGTTSAQVSRSELEFSYEASASAGRGGLSVSAQDSGAEGVNVFSVGQAEAFQSMGTLAGLGEAHVLLTVSLDGQLDGNDQSSGALTVSFDPDDDLGAGDSVTFFRGGGLGAQSIREVLTLESDFSFNFASPRRVYVGLDLQVSDGGHLDATVTQFQLTTTACVP